ncbi:MAG: serine/threonine protein kinase, partial [bacterium]
MIGKTILHYKITEKLGEGGMGEVYKAEDTKLKRDVAIKFLPRQIAAGLQTAHKKGVVHRDIKSANIMITDEDQVKIMDFGLAKLAGQTMLTKSGTTLGTVAYMSPEQARGEKVDQRTDIWSFGVVLYEMLTGQLPFKGDYEQAVMYSIMNEEPEPIAEFRSDVPLKLQQTVDKALQKKPDDRFKEMKAVLKDLRAIVREVESGSVASDSEEEQS